MVAESLRIALGRLLGYPGDSHDNGGYMSRIITIILQSCILTTLTIGVIVLYFTSKHTN